MKFIALGPGRFHTCFVAQGGEEYCWGRARVPPEDARSGLLGDGRDTPADTLIAVTGGHTFVEMDNGNDHACAITGAGALWCWGSNEVGQIGDGSTADALVPRRVASSLAWRDFATDLAISCALDGAGAAWCWGDLRFP